MVDDLEKHCGCIDQNSTMTEALQHSNIRRSSAALDKNGKNSSSGVRGSIVISGMRILVVVSLSLLGVYSSITTFRYMKDDEDDHDHQLPDDRIEEYAARVFDSFEKKLGLHLFALDSFASDIYSYSRHEELEWPLVTLPDFELIGSKFRSLTDTSSVSFLPLVTRRNEWESYVVDNGWWMEESLEYVKQTTGFEPLVRDSSMPKNIWDINGYYDTSIGPFLPLWQTSPFVPDASVYNFNALTHPALEGAFKAVLFTGNAVLGDFIDLSSSENEDYLQRLVGTTVEPHGALFYPVFDSYLPKDSNLVGVLFTVLPWQSILEESVMEKHTGEITCVLENSKGEVHTYSITKEGVTYLGASDLHDKLFDAYEQKREVHSLLRDSLKEQAGQPLTDHYIKYTIRVYPSNQAVIEEFDKRDEEVSSGNATLYTSLAAIGFFFVVCLFLFYDYLVDRQQTERVENALKSSLSTSTGVTVQDEPAFQEPQQASETGIEVQASGGMLTPNVSIEYPKEPSKPIPMPASKLLNNYLKDETECAEEEGTVAEAKPIADFFPNCTVVFAELVGFTAWSSQHEPTQVFLLLQEIYQAFDKEAKKRGVFKIESIGDCYVAGKFTRRRSQGLFTCQTKISHTFCFVL